MMSKSSQLHNVIHIEILRELQLSASQEIVDFESSDVLYAENAYKLKVLYDENSNETAKMKVLFISVMIIHALIIFLESHTASLFI